MCDGHCVTWTRWVYKSPKIMKEGRGLEKGMLEGRFYWWRTHSAWGLLHRDEFCSLRHIRPRISA